MNNYDDKCIMNSTITAAPASSPVDVNSTTIESTSFLLSWNSPPPEDHNGIIRHYVVNVTEENTGRMFQMISTTTHIMLTLLHPYYNYILVVSAVTIEEGPYSVPITIITAQDGKQIIKVNNIVNTSTVCLQIIVYWVGNEKFCIVIMKVNSEIINTLIVKLLCTFFFTDFNIPRVFQLPVPHRKSWKLIQLTQEPSP